MLIGLKEPLQAGDQVMLTLEFAKAAPLEIAVPVITGPPDKD
jgi:copper(I)-binding protein